MKQTLSGLRTRIAKQRQAMIDDPEFTVAMGNLDRAALDEVAGDLRGYFIGYINFVNYIYALFAEKAQLGRLPAEVELRLAGRGDQALEDYEAIIAAAERFGQLCQSTGLAPLLERHLPGLLKYFNHDANYRPIMDDFRTMGVTEIQSSWIMHLLGAENYDVLHFDSANGTIDELVRRVQSCLPLVQRFVTSLHEHGLIVFEGGMPDNGDAGAGDAGGGDAGTRPDAAGGGTKQAPRMEIRKVAASVTPYGKSALSAGLLMMVIGVIYTFL